MSGIRLRPFGHEVVSFWQSAVSGDGWPTPKIPASTEPVTLTGDTPNYTQGQAYDVGAIVAAYQQAWLGPTPNAVTPAALRDLLFFLDAMTASIEQRDLEVRTVDLGEPTGSLVMDCAELNNAMPGYGQACVELARWRRRLDEYMLVLGEVPPERDFDRTATLWTVTAPLFLGWFGGPSGHEIEPVAGGFPPGFDAETQHRADLATPYMLANQYGVADAWEQRRTELLIDDFTPEIPDLPDAEDYKTALLYGAVALGSVLGLGFLLARK